MISKKEAIAILDDYLHHMYNVDPATKTNVKTHRSHISEFDGYWQLHMRSITNHNKITDQLSEWVGGGSFFLDKSDGEIYAIGSNPLIDWHQEYANFKKGLGSEVNWKPAINDYLRCRIESKQLSRDKVELLQCEYDNRDNQLGDFFRAARISSNEHSRYFTFERVAFESDTGEVPVSTHSKLEKESRKVVVQDFVGGMNGYCTALFDIKKYCRVNQLRQNGTYYARIVESDFSKPFIDWRCQLEMPIC